MLEFSKDLIRADRRFDSWINFPASAIKRTGFPFRSPTLRRNKADSSSCCDLGITCVNLRAVEQHGVPLRCKLSDCTREPTTKSLRLMGLKLGRSAQTCWGLNLLERRLVESHTAVIIPFDDRIIFVSSLNCAQLPSRLSEVAQTLHAISRSQFLVGSRGLGERWPPGTV